MLKGICRSALVAARTGAVIDMARMDPADIQQAFLDAGALLTGHFALSSGLHSDRYLEKFRLIERPAALEPMCADIADRFADSGVEYVLGPTTAGIILAYNVARYLGVVARFAEPAANGRTLRRGQTIPAGARVLIVDDILTTGLSVRECMDIVARGGGDLVGVAILGDRSGGKALPGVRLESLLTVEFATYAPEACPLCIAGVPLTKPGTRSAS